MTVEAQSVESCELDVTGYRTSLILYEKQGQGGKTSYYDGIRSVT